jgi:hypothetical protein
MCHTGYADCLLASGQRNCPKHVQFYSKNKFEKKVHLVGFIIRIDQFFFSVTDSRPDLGLTHPSNQMAQCFLLCEWGGPIGMLSLYVYIVSYQAEIKWSLPPLCNPQWRVLRHNLSCRANLLLVSLLKWTEESERKPTNVKCYLLKLY